MRSNTPGGIPRTVITEIFVKFQESSSMRKQKNLAIFEPVCGCFFIVTKDSGNTRIGVRPQDNQYQVHICYKKTEELEVDNKID